jgi:hypothetical protein
LIFFYIVTRANFIVVDLEGGMILVADTGNQVRWKGKGKEEKGKGERGKEEKGKGKGERGGERGKGKGERGKGKRGKGKGERGRKGGFRKVTCQGGKPVVANFFDKSDHQFCCRRVCPE